MLLNYYINIALMVRFCQRAFVSGKAHFILRPEIVSLLIRNVLPFEFNDKNNLQNSQVVTLITAGVYGCLRWHHILWHRNC
jgi:hypothetical protein